MAEDEEIKIPEFDERKFIEKEKRKAKTAFISFSFGILMAIICHFLWINIGENLRWILCFLLAITSIGFMAKILQIMKVDISKFGKKEWASSISFYFFTWLALFILSINPPFYDASSPRIEAVILPEIQQGNGSILIAAHITDNYGIKEAKIRIGENQYEMKKDGSVYIYEYKGNSADFEIIAKDKNDNIKKFNGKIRYEKNLIKVEEIKEEINSSYKIEIRVYKNISKENFRVYYMINGYEINATKDGESNDYYIFITSPKYIGWKENAENEIEVYVEVMHYFAGIDKKYSNKIYGGKYYFTTSSDSNIGKEPSPKIKNLPKPYGLRTPAFSLAAVLLAICFIFVLKRRVHLSRKL